MIFHMNKKIFFDKLFPWKQGVNRNNLHIDHECISYITVPRDANKIVDLISEKMKKYKKKDEITIVDSTACIGGDTIAFCHNFGIVIPIELDPDRYTNLIHNIETYNIQNAFPINGNCMNKIPEININIDVIYIDPPWGGSDYKLKDKMDIQMNDMDLDQIIISFFIKEVKLVVVKLPKNYNYDNLLPKLQKHNLIFDLNKEIKKIDILLIEKMMN
jgi:16S rRNA G966 N2-methylase RsmD